MKNIKKLASLLLAIMMVLCTTTVLATDATPANGSITINGVSDANDYEIYRLLDLESYDLTAKTYSYRVNPAWNAFFATDEAKVYFTVAADGYVTWTNASEADSVVAAFAKIALKYAQDNGIDPVKSSTNEDEFIIADGAGVFSELPLGYYLVDSTVGALCGLTTTNPDASVNAKNGIPTVDKQVKEDSTGNYGGSDSADIGQTIEFLTTIQVQAGAQKYVLHDVMSEGLTYKQLDKVTIIRGNVAETLVTTDYYEVVTEGLEDDCTFEVRFTDAFCDGLEPNDKILVYYSAMLNRNAVVAGDGNPNESYLSFGEKANVSNTDKTQTFTYGFDLVKTDSQNTLIDGAAFRIYDAETGGNEVAVVPLRRINEETGEEEDVPGYYRRARADETGVEIVVTGGQVRVIGFDNGTYYLEETKTPAGYNQLSARQKFIISNANLDATYNNSVFSSGSGVHVVNKSGTMLPETGGMGTTLFYACGGALVLAAVVLLVTKKRMSNAE